MDGENYVYTNVTIHLRNMQQSAENQAGCGKIFFYNVDIMWTYWLIFAT